MENEKTPRDLAIAARESWILTELCGVEGMTPSMLSEARADIRESRKVWRREILALVCLPVDASRADVRACVDAVAK